jgi:hypothetical protein
MQNSTTVSGQALVAPAAVMATNVGAAAINASANCAKQLKEIGALVKRVAVMIDKNAPRAAELAATAFQEGANTQTGKALIQAGGYRASILAAMPNSVIAGGARNYIRSAAKSLKKVGSQCEKLGNMLPGQVLNTAKKLNVMVKRNVTAKNVLKANKALQKVVNGYNRGANSINSAVGTSLPVANVVPVNPTKVVASANAVSKNLVKMAKNSKPASK